MLKRGEYFFSPKYFLPLLLLIGLANGLIYLFLLPPWQHYDEPTHFEYVWMIANSDTIPPVGAYDNSIRLQILNSMKAHNFFLGPQLLELEAAADSMYPIWIGITQVGDPPLYYWLAALPLRVMGGQSIESQLYATRMVSLLLWLGVLVVAWAFMRQVTTAHHPLQWIVPLSLVLLPGFVEHNMALNNDVAANLVYSLILLFGARLIQNEFRWYNLLALLGLMVLSYFTKASLWLSVILIPLGIYLALLRNRRRWWVLGSLGAAALAAGVILFEVNDAGLWFRETSQSQPTKAGQAYQLVDERADRAEALLQIVPDAQQLQGTVVTAAAWLWGQEGLTAYPPALMALTRDFQQVYLRPEPISLSAVPTFSARHYRLPDDFVRLYFVLQPLPNPADTGTVYYQQPILAVGQFSSNQPISFEVDGSSGLWGGTPFENLVRNSDLKTTWPKFRPWIIPLMEKVDPRISEAANWIIYSLDVDATFWYHQDSLTTLFRTFWGKFGWGHVTLAGAKPFRLPLAFSVIGVLAGLVAYWRCPIRQRLYLFLWLSAAIAFILFFAWFTGISGRAFQSKPVFPDSRYVFPIVILVMGLIASGWHALIQRLPAHLRPYGLAVYFAFFIYLNALAIYSIYSFYYG